MTLRVVVRWVGLAAVLSVALASLMWLEEPSARPFMALAVGLFTLANMLEMLFHHIRTTSSPIAATPGARFLSTLPYLLPRTLVAETFEPAVRDMQREYFNALEAGNPLLARIVYVRWCFGTALALLALARSVLTRAGMAKWTLRD